MKARDNFQIQEQNNDQNPIIEYEEIVEDY
jgi:hypothetical protein